MRLRFTFSRKYSLAVLLAAAAVSSLLGPRATMPLRRAARLLLAPLGDGPMYAVTVLGTSLTSRDDAGLSPQEARSLREDNDYLRRLAAYWQYEQEVLDKRCQELSNFQRMYGPARDLACELIPAKVVLAPSLPYEQTREVRPAGQAAPAGALAITRQLITQRSKALPPRLAVVSENHLVGRVVDGGAFTARMQLPTDRGFRLMGRIRRVIAPSRPRTVTVMEGNLPRTAPLTPLNNLPIDVIAEGDGGSHLVVPHVKEYHNVLPGDLLMTATAEENLPVEVHVGQVVEVRRDAKDPHRVTLIIRPHADLENLRDVFIVSPIAPPEAGP